MTPSEKPQPTLADYVAIALSPLLIIALVDSLIFFLVEVLYVGAYADRMRWMFFFFIAGAVLVSRISLTQDIANRSSLYGFFLGALTWIGLQQFVEYPEGSAARLMSPLVNIGLIALIWWSAHRLTADCTQVDDDVESNGEGLMQAAGLEVVEKDETNPAPSKKQSSSDSAGLAVWWERYQAYREKQRKRRTLGVWVVYYSLAALPLFGLGQSLIPPEEIARRRYAFWLMTAYVGSALGLLLTTCFLGLRRYLRQRRLTMPSSMVGVWLTLGGSLVVLLLVVGALLPRPEAEYSLFQLSGAGSGERSASNWATKGGENAGKGEGRPGADGKSNDEKASGGDRGDKGKGGDSGPKGQEKGGSGQGKAEKGGGDQKGDKGSGGDQKGKSDGGKSKDGQKGDASKEAKGAQEKGKGEQSKGKVGDKSQGGDKGTSADKSDPPPTSSIAQFLSALGAILKKIVFVVVALVVLALFIKAIIQFLANFTDWAKSLLDAWNKFWRSLFGSRRTEADGDAAEEEERTEPLPAFDSFHNPFTLGQNWDVRELTRYTFQAFEAWAREHDLPRRPGETALEFADQVGQEVPALAEDGRKLATIYSIAAFARTAPPKNSTEILKQFWRRLEAVEEAPLSA